MKAAFDEAMLNGVKRRQEPERIMGNLFNAVRDGSSLATPTFRRRTDTAGLR